MPQCIIAPLQPPEQHLSFYRFLLDRSALDWAQNKDLTHVSVEQICRRERETDLITGERQFDEWKVGRQLEELRRDPASVYEVRSETSVSSNLTKELSTPACGAYRGSVSSYRVALCTADGNCKSKSRARKLCTFEAGQNGFHLGKAVNAEDVDPWRWRY